MKTQMCCCGCNKKFPVSRIQPVELAGALFPVVEKHIPRLQREIGAAMTLARVVVRLAERPWIERVRAAELVYRLHVLARTRMQGERKAIQSAKKAWWLMVLPKFIGMELIRLTTKTKQPNL